MVVLGERDLFDSLYDSELQHKKACTSMSTLFPSARKCLNKYSSQSVKSETSPQQAVEQPESRMNSRAGAELKVDTT